MKHDMPDHGSAVQPAVSPTKIAFVRQQFSHFGGGELILDRTIAALSERGVPVALIARDWQPREGLTFLRCESPRFPRFSRDSRFAKAACDMVRANEPLLVQSHERIECCDIFRAGDGVHAAYLAHRSRGMSAPARFFQNISLYHRNVLALERRMFASDRLKAVIVNSGMVADEIVSHFSFPRERIHHIPNGIDLARFAPRDMQTAGNAVRGELGIDPNRKVLVFVGSGYERKGLARSIEALAKSKSDAVLLVIGHDRRPSRFAAIAGKLGISDRVQFLGRQKDTTPYYAAADAMILPSLYDPFPSTVLEGLASGLPVVTSESCGARDIARELDPRLVADAYDVEALAAAIDAALALGEKSDTWARCRAIVERFRMEPMIERMLALYQTLASK
jgi:UDP-glucose:(heptosyl)LPS alpha-1,3-glucosyltransferase